MKTILLQAAAASEGGTIFGMNPQLLMFGAIAIIFYFFMIRPQMKKTKEAKAFRDGLTAGDKIVTAGGIHGKVLEIADTTILISTEGGKLRLEKSSVTANEQDQLVNQKK